MADHAPGRPEHEDRGRTMVRAGVMFAGVMLVVTGTVSVLQGAAAIAKDNVYVVGAGYAYTFNVSTWGWIHAVLGALLVITGFGLLSGIRWARWMGLLFASVSLATQFMFLPYYPLWSIIVIALDAFVIWALASEHADVL